jgi:hypothetical protein
MRVFVVKPFQDSPIIIPNIAEVRLSGTGTYVTMYNARGKIVARLPKTKVKEYWIEPDAT